MKANVANYLIQDLSSRFPIKGEDMINADLIDVVIDDWSNNRFLSTRDFIKLRNENQRPERYLM